MFSLPGKPFTYSGKGMARRPAIINEYAEEIDALYDMVSNTTEGEFEAPTSWSETETLHFVRSVVFTALGRDVADGVDLFQFGCDRFVISRLELIEG